MIHMEERFVLVHGFRVHGHLAQLPVVRQSIVVGSVLQSRTTGLLGLREERKDQEPTTPVTSLPLLCLVS